MTGRELWRLIADPAAEPSGSSPSALAASARTFARYASPALANLLLAEAEARLGTPLVDAAEARQSKLMGRFRAARLGAVLRSFRNSGIDCVVLKGFANAYAFYSNPEVRIVGDLDVLVRRDALAETVALLERGGLRCVKLPTPRWGFISDASFMPFVAADGQCNVDLHVEPDSYPVHRSLDARRVFAEARGAVAGTLEIKVPKPEHALILAAANAAKDKFGPYSVRKVVDAIVLLRSGVRLDWHEIETLARRGRYLRPLMAFLGLLDTLGLPQGCVPAQLVLPLSGAAGRELAAVRDDFRTFFPKAPSPPALLRRELLLCAEPAVGMRLALRRVKGLFLPQSGMLTTTST